MKPALRAPAFHRRICCSNPLHLASRTLPAPALVARLPAPALAAPVLVLALASSPSAPTPALPLASPSAPALALPTPRSGRLLTEQQDADGSGCDASASGSYCGAAAVAGGSLVCLLFFDFCSRNWLLVLQFHRSESSSIALLLMVKSYVANVTKCVHVFPEICGSKNSHVCTFHDFRLCYFRVPLQISSNNLNLNKLFMYILGVEATPPISMISPLMTS